MTIFAAAIGKRIGDRHRAKAKQSQDYGCYRLLPGGTGIVAAVSDGAGSAPEAGTGSLVAAHYATMGAWRRATEKSAEPSACVRAGIRAAREKLEERAKRDRRSMENYHTTLIVAAATKNKAAVAHIGDGASIAKTGGQYKMLTIPARGEYANETFFITMDGYKNLTAYNEVHEPEELILFTDGVQNELIDFKGKRADQEALLRLKFLDIPAERNQPTTEAGQLGIRSTTHHLLNQWLEDGQTTHGDDATILIIRPPSEGK